MYWCLRVWRACITQHVGRPLHGSAMQRLWRYAAVSLVVLVGAATRADDWPQWLGPQRDGIWRETGLIEKFPEDGPTVRWRTAIAAGYTGPAVAKGRVYVMDRVLAEGAKNHPEPFPQRPKEGIPGVERVLCLNE